MAGASKVASSTASITKKTESQAAKDLAKERAEKVRQQKKKNTSLGGKKPSETYKKFGFFGYFFLAAEAFIIIALFLVKDLIDIAGTATIVLAGVGEGVGEAISTVVGLILGAFIFVWLWFRFGRSKKGAKAIQQTAKRGLKILGSYVGVWLADMIPVVDKMPWLTIYGLILYGLEFYKMMTQSLKTPPAQEEEAGPPPKQAQARSSLRAELEQKTQTQL